MPGNRWQVRCYPMFLDSFDTEVYTVKIMCELRVLYATQVRQRSVVSSARRKLSMQAASSARPSSWRMRATAGCSWAGACAMTTVTWDARLTSSTSLTLAVRRVDDVLSEFQTLCSPLPSHVPTISSLTSRHATSALKVCSHFIIACDTATEKH